MNDVNKNGNNYWCSFKHIKIFKKQKKNKSNPTETKNMTDNHKWELTKSFAVGLDVNDLEKQATEIQNEIARKLLFLAFKIRPIHTDLIQHELTNVIAVVTWKHQSRVLIHFELSQCDWGHNHNLHFNLEKNTDAVAAVTDDISHPSSSSIYQIQYVNKLSYSYQ